MEYTFRQIKAALDSEDPEGLLAMGAPHNEYYSEASLIEGRIAKVHTDEISADRIADIVAAVWNSQFGPFDEEDLNKRRQAFSSVARRILT